MLMDPIVSILAARPEGSWIKPGNGCGPTSTGATWQSILPDQLGVDRSHGAEREE